MNIPDKSNSTYLFFHIPAKEIAMKFKQLGYKVDFSTSNYFILRNSNFPFQRISIPQSGLVSLFALKHILDSIGMSYKKFKSL